MILFIDACVRSKSRTRQLADFLLQRLEGDVIRLRLSDVLFPMADESFIDMRYDLLGREVYDDPMFDMARTFASADCIVIAAPYWDLSFPAMLKQYLEQICVLGITFFYEDDMPRSLCRAQSLYYVTTAGGPIISDEPGFGYVRALAQTFFGIPKIKQIKAEGLDLAGADTEGIMQEALQRIGKMEL